MHRLPPRRDGSLPTLKVLRLVPLLNLFVTIWCRDLKCNFANFLQTILWPFLKGLHTKFRFVYNRPLAKLRELFKIANTRDQRKP